jgi:hypothetical protein
MNTVEFPAGNRQVPGFPGTHGEENGIKFVPKITDGNILSDGYAGFKKYTLGGQLFQTPINHGLVKLEIRDAVTQQSADFTVFLEKSNSMTGSPQLL